MIWQFHHQWPDGRQEMVSQDEANDSWNQERAMKWLNDWFTGVQRRHPLPPGANYLLCNERAPEFLWAVHD